MFFARSGALLGGLSDKEKRRGANMTGRLIWGIARAIFAASLWANAASADEYDSAVSAVNKLPNMKVFNLNVPNGIVLVFADRTKQNLAEAAATICGVLKANSAEDIKKVRFLDGPAHDKEDTIRIVETIPCK
jgi:hypothetical protein